MRSPPLPGQYPLPFPSDFLRPREAPASAKRRFRAEKPTRGRPPETDPRMAPVDTDPRIRPWWRPSGEHRRSGRPIEPKHLPPTSQRGPWQRITSLRPSEKLAKERRALIVQQAEAQRRAAAAEEYLSRVRSQLLNQYTYDVAQELLERNASEVDEAFEAGRPASSIARSILTNETVYLSQRRPRGRLEPGAFRGRKLYKGPLPAEWYETPNCAAYFTAGKDAPMVPSPEYQGEEIPVEPYGVCLTPTQLARIMRGGRVEGRRLGCGVFACVWQKGNRTIKFTHDSEDVAAVLNSRGIRHTKKFYKIYRLVDSGRITRTGKPTPVWAMVGEDVPPVSEDDPRYRWIMRLPLRVLYADYQEWQYAGRFPEDYQPSPYVDEEVRDQCARMEGSDPTYDTCKRFIGEFVDVWAQLARRGTIFMDAHAGNIGVDSRGVWKITDLGLSKAEIPEELVESLRGLRAGMASRRRDRRAVRAMWLGAATLAVVLVLPALTR